MSAINPRLDQAAYALYAYSLRKQIPFENKIPASVISELICDLLHLTCERGIEVDDPLDIAATALSQFMAETKVT